MLKSILFFEKIFDKIHFYTEDVVLLFLRLYVAQVIFKSGWVKFSQWEATLMIFESSTFPLLSYQLLAIISTFLELILPLLIFFGLFARPAALFLMVHIGITLFYIEMFREDGFYNHIEVGLILLMIMFWGVGKITLQFLIVQYFNERRRHIE